MAACLRTNVIMRRLASLPGISPAPVCRVVQWLAPSVTGVHSSSGASTNSAPISANRSAA